jgi:hypothetical protein
MSGKAEVSVWYSVSEYVTIPASMLSEVVVELTEGTRSRETLGGTFTTPSGILETAQVRFTMFLPNMDYLGQIFPSLYNAPSGTQDGGNLIIGSDDCVVADDAKVNIHYTCESTDNNDIFIFAGRPSINFNPTYNQSDDLSVEVIFHAQPTASGVARLGTGNLTAEAVYNPATGETDVVTS